MVAGFGATPPNFPIREPPTIQHTIRRPQRFHLAVIPSGDVDEQVAHRADADRDSDVRAGYLDGVDDGAVARAETVLASRQRGPPAHSSNSSGFAQRYTEPSSS